MIIGADTSEKGVGADGGSRTLGQIADNDRMMISAGRLEKQLTQQRMGGSA